jgi:hypothetical protein
MTSQHPPTALDAAARIELNVQTTASVERHIQTDEQFSHGLAAALIRD